jgi:hypothetical protein
VIDTTPRNNIIHKISDPAYSKLDSQASMPELLFHFDPLYIARKGPSENVSCLQPEGSESNLAGLSMNTG